MDKLAFFKVKLVLKAEDRGLLLGLLARLNQANIKAWAWAQRDALKPKDMTAAKLLGCGP